MYGVYLILSFFSHSLLSLAVPQHERPAATSIQPPQTSSGLAPRQNDAHELLALVSVLRPWWLPDPTPASKATGKTTKPRSTVTIPVTPGGGTLTTIKWVTPSPTPIRHTSTKVVWVTAADKRGEREREATPPTATAVATPSPSSSPLTPLEARKNILDISELEDPPSPGDINVCTKPDFKGECERIHSTTYKCHNVPPNWALAIMAVRPDPGQCCNFYTKWECEQTGASWISNVRSPGFSDLRTVGLDDQILSWECWEDDCDDVQDEGGAGRIPTGRQSMVSPRATGEQRYDK